MAFHRVEPVSLGVRDVVDGVDGAREDAEDPERTGGAEKQSRLEQVLREEDGREHENVLHPLVRTNGAREAAGPPAAWSRRSAARNAPTMTAAPRLRRGGHSGCSCRKWGGVRGRSPSPGPDLSTDPSNRNTVRAALILGQRPASREASR